MDWQKVNKSKGIPALGTDCIVLLKSGLVFRAQRRNDWYGGWRTGYNDPASHGGASLSSVTHFTPFEVPK